jgi:YidC/Oxa1 family membrane protein insertase
MTTNHNPQILSDINQNFGKMNHFTLDQTLASQGTVHDFDLMITDWSGAGLEYAFGLERPVLFVDVPKKVNNPEYQEIHITPIEVALRREIGLIVTPDHLTEVPEKISVLFDGPHIWRDKIKAIRSKWVYNVGKSAEIGAAHINEICEAISR